MVGSGAARRVRAGPSWGQKYISSFSGAPLRPSGDPAEAPVGWMGGPAARHNNTGPGATLCPGFRARVQGRYAAWLAARREPAGPE